jgi:hypothetical protein
LIQHLLKEIKVGGYPSAKYPKGRRVKPRPEWWANSRKKYGSIFG